MVSLRHFVSGRVLGSMHTLTRPFALLSISFVLASCGRSDYGSGCEKGVEPTAPWTEMGLTLADGNTRVCKVSPDELTFRSYAWKNKEEAAAALEQTLVASGFVKDRCSGPACYFDRGGQEVSVHPMDFAVKKRKLVTAVMHLRADRGAKPSGKVKTGEAKTDEADPEIAAVEGSLGVAECDAYVAQVEGCATFKRDAKPYVMMLQTWRQKIDEGQADQVAQACSKASSMFKCPKA